MLISPTGQRLSIRQPVTMSQEMTQLLIDAEMFWLNLGLVYDLRCIACMKSGDRESAFCIGSVNDDHTAFTVECGCSTRVGLGDFTAPMAPNVTHRRERLEEKRVQQLTRDEMGQIHAFEVALNRLGLQYLLRCQRCRLDDQPDGITGVHESTDSLVVLECSCTRREYRGPDAPLVH